jgi:hypothetical protein
MDRCWDFEPEKRPGFAEVALEAEKIYRDHRSGGDSSVYGSLKSRNLNSQKYYDITPKCVKHLSYPYPYPIPPPHSTSSPPRPNVIAAPSKRHHPQPHHRPIHHIAAAVTTADPAVTVNANVHAEVNANAIVHMH